MLRSEPPTPRSLGAEAQAELLIPAQSSSPDPVSEVISGDSRGKMTRWVGFRTSLASDGVREAVQGCFSGLAGGQKRTAHSGGPRTRVCFASRCPSLPAPCDPSASLRCPQPRAPEGGFAALIPVPTRVLLDLPANTPPSTVFSRPFYAPTLPCLDLLLCQRRSLHASVSWTLLSLTVASRPFTYMRTRVNVWWS